MEIYRPLLQEKTQNYSEQLILSSQGRLAFIHSLFKTLKGINHTIKNTKQIRASVISHWLKHYNIREVQYMAGHRYISSTERYLRDDLEYLQDTIESLHQVG